MKEPIWIGKELILVLHEEMLAEFGGSAGIRDEGLLDSALGKPRNRFGYEEPSLFELAASYACGIVGNHPFIDGNKRTGFMAAYTFLGRNGLTLIASEAEAAAVFISLATGEMNAVQLAGWFKQNCRKSPIPRKKR